MFSTAYQAQRIHISSCYQPGSLQVLYQPSHDLDSRSTHHILNPHLPSTNRYQSAAMTQSLLNLPTELLLLIFKQLATIKDAHHLSQCCLQVNRLFITPAYRRDIVRSIADVPSRPEYNLDAAFSGTWFPVGY